MTRSIEFTTETKIGGDRCTITVSETGIVFSRPNIASALLDLDEFDAIAEEVARYRRLLAAIETEDAA